MLHENSLFQQTNRYALSYWTICPLSPFVEYRFSQPPWTISKSRLSNGASIIACPVITLVLLRYQRQLCVPCLGGEPGIRTGIPYTREIDVIGSNIARYHGFRTVIFWLTLFKDADINIEFTGLTIPTGAKKVVFTIKDNLDDADTASALQATYQLTAMAAEIHTLNYINSAVPPVLTTPVTFTVDTDSVEFDMTAAAAYYLPRYERGYLHWDLKLITATTVQILQQGLVQILGTSTRTVA